MSNIIQKVTILEQGIINTTDDLLRLNIVAWHRLNGYFDHIGEAVDIASSWLVGRAAYTRVAVDMHAIPDRSDFPDWTHPGMHEDVARSYWNWWHAVNTGILVLSDEPDFWGELMTGGIYQRFWGDIGQVSASTFIMTIKGLSKGDLWITVPDDQHQIVIEMLSTNLGEDGMFEERLKLIETLGPISPEVITAMKEGIMTLVEEEASDE